ncbi:MAG TPA: NAD(P)/FAD-dependent oxidoreductase [Anaerolinea thermolimosa]|uniref:NAD(P)/FAD-dependent oxidoreductase n=1 Tax=Anaerolinea thermolimosa TaxID=229919 RepID=A0A3D1JFF7_9CHLR|nr:flavoprotein, HI0933 family [Anaerolinea thermolimosa]HCE17223.1 NAD(P)/FAD-dependent oxidoreductase [Anaerolinea thermolimosa]
MVSYNQSVNPAPAIELLVIGGGPAGFFAALTLAEARPRSSIVILEKASTVLGKVRISGGGRCNVTHACFDPAILTRFYPRGGRELRGVFARFQPADTIRWFESHGVLLKTEEDGRVFPVSNSSETIISCLTGEAARQGIEVHTHTRVKSLERTPEGTFVATCHDGTLWHTRRVILATGGEGGFHLAAGLGHTIQPPVPSLFTFKIHDPRFEGLQGISIPAVRLWLPTANIHSEGALLITHWGLSGPAVLRLSAWGARVLHQHNYQLALTIHWLPGLSEDGVMAHLKNQRSHHGRKRVTAWCPFEAIAQRLWQKLVLSAEIPETTTWSTLTRQQIVRLAQELTAGRYEIAGKAPFKDEFVTCGGVTLDEVDFRTLESRLVPGLFLAGEVLDIDGLTGGFNLQNAWSTGWVAGRAIAGKT